MRWWHVYLAAGGTAAVLSAALTWGCRALAPRLGLVDRPALQSHKRHGRDVPMLGGAAMFVAWVLTILGGLVFSSLCGGLVSTQLAAYLPGVQTVLPQLASIMLGAFGLVLLGLVDDYAVLHAFTKLAGQFCIAGAVACWGVRVTLFWTQPLATWTLTTFWILLVINAINFFDNMDGLAAGTAAVAAFLFAYVAAVRGQYFVAVLSAVTCGTALGFLVFNRAPATIFMGDAGSHLLGYLLAIAGALTTFYTPAEREALAPMLAPVLVPVLIVGLPIFDLFAVVLIRLHHRRPIYVGDHWHISHRFVRLGLSRAEAVLVLWLLAFATGAGAVMLLWLPPAGTAIMLLQVTAILALVSLIQFFGTDTKEDAC